MLFSHAIGVDFFHDSGAGGIIGQNIWRQIPLVIENESKLQSEPAEENTIHKLIKRINLPPGMDKDRILIWQKRRYLYIQSFDEEQTCWNYFDPDTWYRSQIAVRS